MELQTILNWVSVYGPPALAALLVLGIVGLPVPDETLLVFSGYLIYRGTFHAPTVWIAAFLGSVCGITLSYTIGRTLGLGFIHRYGRRFGATEERIAKVHEWFEGVGHWGLAFGYFIPGVRHFTAIVAGTSLLELRIFMTFAYGGALVWVSTFLTIGYVLGEQWKAASENAHKVLLGATILLAVAGLAYWWFVKRRKS